MRKRKIINEFGYAASSNFGAPLWWFSGGELHINLDSLKRGTTFYSGVHKGWCSPFVYCKSRPYWVKERK